MARVFLLMVYGVLGEMLFGKSPQFIGRGNRIPLGL